MLSKADLVFCSGKESIQPDQKHAGIGMRLAHHFLGAFFVVLSHAHAKPVTSYWTAELEHLGSTIPTREPLFQLARVIRILKSPDLHAPPSAFLDGRRGFQDFDPHQRRAMLVDAQFA